MRGTRAPGDSDRSQSLRPGLGNRNASTRFARQAKTSPFDPVQLDRSVKYAYSPLVARLIRTFASVRPGMRIVELGCGTGFWGRLLAKGLRGQGSLLGIDSDPVMVEAAKVAFRRSGLDLANSQLGDAVATGLPDGFADLTTCHRLLTVVEDPLAVVREMMRITKSGGVVLVNEHDHSRQLFWDPDDPGLAQLRHRGLQAFVQATRHVHHRDNALGAQLPAIAIASGLTDLRLLGVLVPYGPLPFDKRVADDELVEYFQWLAEETQRRDPDIADAGGVDWTDAEDEEYIGRELRAIRGRLSSHRSLRSWGRITLVPRLLLRGKVPRF